MSRTRILRILVTAAALGLAVVGMTFALQDERPSLLPGLAGCFQAEGAGPKVQVSRDGWMTSGDLKTRVTILEDKEGLSFFPEKRIEVSADGNSLAFASGSPLKLRISADRASFETFDSARKFVRQSC